MESSISSTIPFKIGYGATIYPPKSQDLNYSLQKEEKNS